MTEWSLIDDRPSSAAFNMAADEFMLDRACRGGVEPVLRIYGFDPPAVTVGFHQDPHRILDLDALAGDGIELARRITGGRALLHDGELTYCVVSPLDHPSFGGGLQKTFLEISAAVVDALRAIGVPARISGGKRAHRREGMDAPCLVSTSRHEVTSGGRKIVGSAQRRTRSAFLQHGSILVRPASARIADYMRGERQEISSMVTSVYEETGSETAEESLRKALPGSFAARFGVALAARTLDPGDLEEIGARARLKAEEFSREETKGR